MKTIGMKAGAAAGACALAALALAACGRMGDLEPPSARESQRAQRGAEAGAMAEPATVNRPPTQLPIEGTTSNPFAGSGAYPEDRPDAR